MNQDLNTSNSSVEKGALREGGFVSLSELAPKTPYSAEYLSLLARRKKLFARKVDNVWYTTEAALSEYQKKQESRMENQNKSGDKDWLSLSELAPKTQYSAEYLSLLARRKKLFARKVDNVWYTTEAALSEYQKTQETKTEPVNILSFIEPVSTSANFSLPVKHDLRLKKKLAPGTYFKTAAMALSLVMGVGMILSLSRQVGSVASDQSQLATVSLFEAVSDSLDLFVQGWNSFKDLALGTLSTQAPKLTEETPKIETLPKDTTPAPVAITETAKPLNNDSFRSELKAELESYIRTQLSSAQAPINYYTSSPVIERTVLREEILLADTRPTVTRQSDSDSNRVSTLLGGLTDGGTFVNGTFTDSAFSGTGSFTSLGFTNATGTSATTTNFFATTASSTNLFANLATFGSLTATAASSTTFAITGDGAGLTFSGSGNHDISASAGTLRIGANTIIGNILALDDTVDIGSAATRFDKIYANEVNATTLVGTLTGGNLTAETFSINSDNATADTEDGFLAFERGSVSPNALLRWNATNDQFDFNNELVVSSGGVGIGTTDPVSTANLHIHADNARNILFTDSTSGSTASDGTYIGNDGTAFEIINQENGYLRFYTNGDDRMRITADGDVGIGTTLPLTTLSVAGDMDLGFVSGGVLKSQVSHSGDDLYLDNRTSNGDIYLRTFSNQIRLTADGATGFIGIGTTTPRGLLGLNDPAGTDSFVVGSATPKFIIKDSGNVGIGTVSPDGDLHIEDTAGNALIQLSESDVLEFNMYWDFVSNRAVLETGSYAYPIVIRGSTTSLGDSTGFDILNVSGGNVGIGTTTPYSLLSVEHASTAHIRAKSTGTGATSHLILQTGAVTTNDGGGEIRFNNGNDGTRAMIQARRDTTLGDWPINFESSASGNVVSGTPHMTIRGSGNVGIGNTDPQGKLQVDGSVYVASNNGSIDYALSLGAKNSVEGAIGYNLKFGASSYTYASNDFSSMLEFPAGGFRFNTAPSGTAGNAITYTQGMFLNQSGNLSLGTIAVPDARLHIGASQASKTIVGDSRVLILENTDGGVAIGNLQEIGMGYGGGGGVTYQPIVLGHKVTALGDVTKGDFYIATRDATTDTAPTERFYITAAGKIGIGTTNPGEKLEINGALGFDSSVNGAINSENSVRINIDSDNNGTESFYVGHNQTTVDANNTLFYVGGDGKVGAGTATPDNRLHVFTADSGGSSDSGSLLTLENAGSPSLQFLGSTSGTQQIRFGDSGDNGAGAVSYNHSTNQFSVRVNGSNSAGIDIDSAGDVGIGDTSPDYKLELNDGEFALGDADVAHGITGEAETDTFFKASVVNGLSGGVLLRGLADDDSTVPFRLLGILGNNDPADTVPAVQILTAKKNGTAIADVGSSEMAFQVSDSNDTDDFFTVLGSGNVGIGTSAPGARLHVKGGSTGEALHIQTAVQLVATDYATRGDLITMSRNDLPSSYLSKITGSWSGAANADNTLNFEVPNTSGVTATILTMTGGGNVGIGTTNPGNTLHIQKSTGATMKIENTGADGVDLFLDSDRTTENNVIGTFGGQWNGTTVGQFQVLAGPDTTNKDDGKLAFRTANNGTLATAMTITHNQRVGIGTTTPESLLHVYGAQPALSLDNTTGSSKRTAINFMSTSTAQFQLGTDTSANSTRDFYLYDSTQGAFRWVVDSSGNFGIGTSTPQSKFHVLGGATGGAARFDADNNNSAVSFYNGSGTKFGEIVTAGGLLFDAENSNDIVFRTDDTPRMSIKDTTGNVGIGTTSPLASLHVMGTGGSATSPLVRFDSGGTTNSSYLQIGNTLGAAGAASALVMMKSGQEWRVGLGAQSGTNSLEFYDATNAVHRMTIQNNGNLGIGTSAPGQMLTVAGSVGFLGIGNGAGTAYLCQTLATGVVSTSTTACNPSSLKYKENVADLAYGLDEVLAMRSVSYDYKPELLVEGHQVGFIAEELHEIIPEVVGLKDGKPDNIDYAKLTSVLVKAIQDLYTEFSSLKETVLAFAENIVSDRVVVNNEFCFDDLCINKEQFRTILQNNGIIATSAEASQPTTEQNGGNGTNGEEEIESTPDSTSSFDSAQDESLQAEPSSETEPPSETVAPEPTPEPTTENGTNGENGVEGEATTADPAPAPEPESSPVASGSTPEA